LDKNSNKVTIVGRGTMGNGIALLFAAKGWRAVINARDHSKDEQSLNMIKANLELLASYDLIGAERIEDTLERISFETNLEIAVAGSDLVIESIVEDLPTKQECFAVLDKICPADVILASNTSAISITEIGEKCANRERIIGTHFWNPPFLLPLVEVVRTEYTKDEIVDRTMKIMNSVGKKPIVVAKDVPGFLANRLQHALVREAFYIVQEGIASPADVDAAINYSFGMRLPFTAPMATSDSCGLDMAASIQSYLFQHLGNSTGPEPVLKEKIDKGELGFKTGGIGMMTWTEQEQEQYRHDLVVNLIKVGKALDRF